MKRKVKPAAPKEVLNKLEVKHHHHFIYKVHFTHTVWSKVLNKGKFKNRKRGTSDTKVCYSYFYHIGIRFCTRRAQGLKQKTCLINKFFICCTLLIIDGRSLQCKSVRCKRKQTLQDMLLLESNSTLHQATSQHHPLSVYFPTTEELHVFLQMISQMTPKVIPESPKRFPTYIM